MREIYVCLASIFVLLHIVLYLHGNDGSQNGWVIPKISNCCLFLFLQVKTVNDGYRRRGGAKLAPNERYQICILVLMLVS